VLKFSDAYPLESKNKLKGCSWT